MAGTGKSIRSARTTFNGGNLGGGLPQEHSQLVAHEVHQYRSDFEGLEGLNASLDNFFGLVSQGIMQVREGLEAGQRAKIKQENEAQARKGAADAMLGREMDPDLIGDLDYYNAFRSVRAQRDAYQAAQDFRTWYLADWLPQNPTGNLAAAREEWAASNLTGSDDREYEGLLLASFFSSTDQLVSQHVETAYKYQTQKGIQTLGEAISARVAAGDLTASDLPVFIDQARALDPLNAAEAQSRVMTALVAAATNHPDKAMQIANLLMEPGTGMNGKSFAESWPETFAQFHAQAEASWSSINSLREAAALDELKRQFREAKTPEDYADLLVQIELFHQQYGAPGATEAMQNSIASAMATLEKKAAERAAADAWLGGDPQGDPKYLKENWNDYLEESLGVRNILHTDPAVGAQLVQDLRGIVPTQLKEQLSAAIADSRDGEAQARAFEFLTTLAQNAGENYAEAYLNDNAKMLFKSVYARMTLTDEPMASIIATVNDAMGGIEDLNAGWDTITGKAKAEEWRPMVHDAIRKHLRQYLQLSDGFFGIGAEPLDIPPSAMEEIEQMARSHALLATATGASWEVGIKNAMELLAGSSEIIPGADGKLMFRMGVDDSHLTYLTEKGEVATRVRLGTKVYNETSKDFVNTVEVFRQDTRAMQESYPWIIPGGDPDAVALRPMKQDSPLGSQGLFRVEVDGKPVIFYPGQTVKADVVTNMFGQQTVPIRDRSGRMIGARPAPEGLQAETVLPDDPAQLEAMLADLPEGYHLVPMQFPGVDVVGYQLAYRPHFGDQKGMTIDEREAAFVPPMTGGTPEQNMGIGDFFMRDPDTTENPWF